jgi:hypothetical protein
MAVPVPVRRLDAQEFAIYAFAQLRPIACPISLCYLLLDVDVDVDVDAVVVGESFVVGENFVVGKNFIVMGWEDRQ